MKVVHDKKIDAIYIRFTDMPYAYGVDLDEDRRIDYDVNGKPCAVELHTLNNGVILDDLPNVSEIESVLAKKGIKVYA